MALDARIDIRDNCGQLPCTWYSILMIDIALLINTRFIYAHPLIMDNANIQYGSLCQNNNFASKFILNLFKDTLSWRDSFGMNSMDWVS